MQKINFFPREFLDELKLSTNIVTVAARYMPLRARGRQHWGLCPFHHEKTPSFAINEQQQFFKCFGCGESGNVITLVKQLESVDFPEAVELLAKLANLEVPTKRVDPEYLKKRKQKERIHAALDAAKTYYCETLYHERNASSLKYLHQRGITTELIGKFNIGVSDTWDGALIYLRAKGFTESELLDAGVAAKSDKGTTYDAMGTRITFPIFDGFGNCIGFTGRTLNDDKAVAKYRNTAQTMVFDKGSIVYGINVLKREKLTNFVDKLIVVEGNVDVITLVGSGFTNTLASMGTALTSFHAKTFSRFSPNVYLCFDGDDSGQKAALRAVDVLAAEGLQVRVVQLPPDTDPDTCVTKNGPDAFSELVRAAIPYIDFKLDFLMKDSNLNDNLGRAEYLKRAATILSHIASSPELELYLPKVSMHSNISIDGVRRAILGTTPPGTNDNRPGQSAPPEPQLPISYERTVISGLISGLFRIDENIEIQFTYGLFRRLYDIILAYREKELEWKSGLLEPDDFDAEDRQKIEQLLDIPDDQVKRNFFDALRQMQKNALERRIESLQNKHKETDNRSERSEILQKIKKLLDEKKTLR